MLDCVAQLQTAADGIYNRPVFFVNDAGEGMSIQMMHDHNADVTALQKSDQKSDLNDVVYLMYALITCQLWWQVSIFVEKDAQLKSGMSARHDTFTCTNNMRVCVCVFVHRNVSDS